MNAFYVIVSIPLLLVLAGFNHAHGLTTFGKTQSPSSNTQPVTPARPCLSHSTCAGITGTSCVQDPRDHAKMSCLCGDNQPPINGACQISYRGPKHQCDQLSDCVENADCLPMNKSGQPKTCQCMEGYISHNNMCSGAFQISASFSGLLLIFLSILWNNNYNMHYN